MNCNTYLDMIIKQKNDEDLENIVDFFFFYYRSICIIDDGAC